MVFESQKEKSGSPSWIRKRPQIPFPEFHREDKLFLEK